jgi:hypothetical protein
MRLVAAIAIVGGLAAVCAGWPVPGGSGSVSRQGYSGSAIVSADGRTLTVGPYALSCPATVTVVGRESVGRVALFVQYLTPENPPACPPGSGTAALRAEQTVRLRAPLGRRRLVDGATGSPTPWISARFVLRPAGLPPGYRLSEMRPWLNLTSRSLPACVQFFQASGDPDVLEIIQSAGRAPVLGGAGDWTKIRVRGHPGRASRNLITWRENGLMDYVLIGEQSPAGPQVLSTRQLVAIADSAPD